MAIFNGKIHYKWPFSVATLKYLHPKKWFFSSGKEKKYHLPWGVPIYSNWLAGDIPICFDLFVDIWCIY